MSTIPIIPGGTPPDDSPPFPGLSVVGIGSSVHLFGQAHLVLR